MRDRCIVSWAELHDQVAVLACVLSRVGRLGNFGSLYGVPSGGSHVALMLQHAIAKQTSTWLPLVSVPESNTLVVDDICDSGATLALYPDHMSAVLHVRPSSRHVPTYYVAETEDWVVYPYEKQEEPGSEIVTRMLEFLGEDPKREGLRDTPARVARAWQELFSGYRVDVALTTFEDSCDEVVLVRDITFASFCEHHLLPFYGRAHVGYLPAGRIVGLSKLARLVEKYARRLQVQERLTQQVAAELQEALRPAAVGVVVEATHLCMVLRGVRQPDAVTVTSAMLGRFRESDAARAEFMALVRGRA